MARGARPARHLRDTPGGVLDEVGAPRPGVGDVESEPTRTRNVGQSCSCRVSGLLALRAPRHEMPTGAALIRDAHRHMIHAEGEPGGRRDERIRGEHSRVPERGHVRIALDAQRHEADRTAEVSIAVLVVAEDDAAATHERHVAAAGAVSTEIAAEVLRPELVGVDLGPFGDRREFVRLERQKALRLGAWLREAGLEPEVVLGEEVPASLDGYAGLVMLGGGLMPDDDERAPWLARERGLAEQAIARDLPTLGICLGGQILAHVAGGTVRAKTGPKERGATQISPTAAGTIDAVLSALGEGAPMIENHEDMITVLPPSATLLASSTAVANQAFLLGEHVRGLQFHPEVSADDLLGWEEPVIPGPDDLPLAQIVAAARAVDGANTAAAHALVAAFAADVAAVAAVAAGDADRHSLTSPA